FRKSQLEDEMGEELRFHLEKQIEDNIKAGMTGEEARYAALRSFGGVEQIKEECRDMRGTRCIEDLVQDLRYGLRTLRRSPGFATVAVLVLGLGIGANIAIFSVANGVLLRPLPYADPERLALIRLDFRGVTGHAGIAPAEVQDFRRHTRLFEGFEVIAPNNSSLTGEIMEKIPSATITEGLIPLLGVRPLLGMASSDTAAGPQNRVWDVVISYELWQTRFGGDKQIIGRKIEVNNFNPAVVAVMPRGFRMYLGPGTNLPERIDLFFLGSLTADGLGTSRSDHSLTTVARLRPGVTFKRAQGEIDAIAADLARQYAKVYGNTSVRFHLVPLHKDLVGRVRPAILALLGAVGFVLLIACANVAHLVLTRTSARANELAVRCALGAGRSRIIRQLLTENLLISLIGGAAGLFIAVEGVHLLLFLRPANLPRQETIGIDGAVLAATLLLSLIPGVGLGLISAWQSTKGDINESLKTGGRQPFGGPGRLRNTLVTAEVALSLVLLVGAGSMIRTFAKLSRFDWGLDPTHLLTLQVNIQPRSFTAHESRWRFYQQALEKVRVLPGVEAVSGALGETAQEPLSASLHTVLPEYFHSMGIRMLAGRDFAPQEYEQQLAVAIIDANLASHAWPSESPIGKRILWRPRTKEQKWLEVVGMVEHVRAAGFREEGDPQIYVPYMSHPIFDVALVVRSKTDPLTLAGVIKKEVERLGTRRPVHTIRTMDEYVADQLAETRFALVLMGIFASIALALCLIGLYGVIAYSVSRRTHEIGIRLALGAEARAVERLVLAQGIRLVATGIFAGLTGAFALTRALSSLVYGVSVTDPVTFAGIAVLLGAVALLACYLPARRAAKIDPIAALRCE
ncbi:MAG: hypothetical protein DMG09_26065, partial [Acidobacteria bacterium]